MPAARSSRAQRQDKAAASAAPPTDRFLQAYREYLRSLQEKVLGSELAQRPERAYRDYLQVLFEQQAPLDTRERLSQGYEELMASMRDQPQGASADGTTRVAEAYTRYTKVLEDLMTDRQDSVAAAQRYYLETLRATPSQLRQHSEEAFRTYLHSLQQAWADLDVDSLEVSDLAVISQSIALAAAAQGAATSAMPAPGP
jgi:hypothetical protein